MRSRGPLVMLMVAALGLAGCASDSGTPTPSASRSASSTATAVQRATAALLSGDQVPPAPPGTIVDLGTALTAEGAAVSQPWGQFMVCPIVPSRPDEGPAVDVEPDALAGAWAFGTAGAAQLDQYAIVYADVGAAEAAVTRARTQADNCDEAYTENPEYVGEPPETQIGAVPSGVEGFRVYAVFTHDQGASRSDEVSTVMRVGDVVHYMRTATSGYETDSGGSSPPPSGMLDPQWTEAVIQAAADNLVAAAG